MSQLKETNGIAFNCIAQQVGKQHLQMHGVVAVIELNQ